MNFPRWALSEGLCILRTSEHTTLAPSATEIFQAAFRQRDIKGDAASNPSPQQDIPDITFSRFPAKLAIRVSGQTPLMLFLERGILISGSFYKNDWSNDQVIINNSWYPIKTEDLKEEKDWLAKTGIFSDKNITLGQFIFLIGNPRESLNLVDATHTFENISTPHIEKNETPPPEGLNAVLYPYQEKGINFLTAIANQDVGCILGDEMGLGKTLQIIGLMLYLHHKKRMPCLVVAPATLLENWRREIANFAPTLRTHVHAGPSRTGTPTGLSNIDIIITSYETAIRDEILLNNFCWELVALDEAQNIKNPDALRAQVVKRLNRKISVAITGTPIENQLEDLWSVADFSLKGLLGSLKEFQSRYSNSVEDALSVAPIIAPILLRRRVEEVASDLPSRINIPQAIELGEELSNVYEIIRLKAIEEYGPAGGLVATTHLRLFCSHPTLTKHIYDASTASSPKLVRLLEILGEIFDNGEKVLIFTTYQEMLDIFMKDVSAIWPQNFLGFIDSRVDIKKRQPLVDSFFKHTGAGALFLNPKAAGTGLNITAANHVVHYNPEWNPALTDQATARAYRRRQTKPVTVHYLFYKDTIEQTIIERAEFKRDLAKGAISESQDDVDPLSISMALQISPIGKERG